MGSPLTSQIWSHYETDAVSINAFIALDGSSNVVGYAPTSAGSLNLTTAYTRAKGMQKAIGQAGAIITQPHTATGVYLFTLDEPWFGCVNAAANLIDPGAVASLTPYVDSNVTTATSGLGWFPGQNMTLAAQTVRVRWRNTAGALTDPTVSTGFFLTLTLKRSGVV